MIWHIFRKDCRQLWRLGAIVTAAQFTNAALRFGLGSFNQPRGLVTFAELFSAATVLGMAALIVAVVQEDVVPGVSQDWLVRPVRRGDLLVAKLLFVAAVVQGPALLADLAHGMAAGSTFGDSVAAGLSRGAVMLLVFDVPVLALAAITSTLVQVLATLLGIWLIVVTGVFAGVLARGGAPPPFASSGIQWMTPAYWSLLACASALVIIPLQYFRRATRKSRRIVAGAVLLAPVLSVSTWTSAFAVQQRLSPNTRVAEPVRIAFDPAAGIITAPPGATSTRTLLLPLRVSGLAAESMLMNDRAEVRLVSHDGATLYRQKTTPTLGYGDDFVVRTTAGGDVRTRQRIVLPERVYDRLRDQPVRVEVDYSLTLFDIAAAGAIAATHGDQRVTAFGRCRTQIDEDGDEIVLGCVQAGAAPTCVSVTLENRATGRRNPDQWSCAPDYTPYHTHLYPDATGRFGMSVKVPGLEMDGHAVDGSQLPTSTLTLKAYRPEAHFTRRLVIPDLRLAE